MFLVLEMQSNQETLSSLTFSYQNKLDAESKYHALLSVAAVSSVPIHSVVMLSEEGVPIHHDYYAHPVENVT